MNWIYSVFLFLLFILNHTSSFSQSTDLSDNEKLDIRANSYLGIAKQTENYDTAFFYAKKALPLFEQSGNKHGIVSCNNYFATVHFYREEKEEAFQMLESNWEIAQQHLSIDDPSYLDILSNMSVVHESKGDFEKAIKFYNKYIEVAKKTSVDKTSLAIVYDNLANFYVTFLGDYERGYQYFKEAIHLIKGLENNSSHLAGLYSSTALCFKETKDFKTAFSFCNKSLQELSRLKREPFINQIYWYNYQNMAEIYLEKNQLDSALFYINRAFLIIQNDNSIFEDYRTYQTQGNIYLRQNQQDKAISFFKKAIQSAQKEPEVHKYASALNHLGNVFFDLEKTDLALQNYHQGVLALSNQVNKDRIEMMTRDIYKNPDLDSLLYKKNALEILHGKAKTFFQKYRSNGDEKDLLAAFEGFELASNIIQKIRQDHAEDISKYTLAEKTLSIYENAIEVALELFQTTNDFKYKETAFQFAESNKSVLLMESIRENTAKGFGVLPDSLLKIENKLKIEIAFLNKQIFEKKQAGKNYDHLQSNLFQEREKKNNLIAKIEKDYPKYHQLKYGTQKTSIQQIQKKSLDDASVLFEFFVGEKSIYLFSITKDDFDIQFFPKSNDLEKQVQNLRTLLSAPPISKTYKDNLLVFQKTAQSLHDIFLKKQLSNLSPNINRLVIIPDDFLNYLPFEILITKKSEEPKNDYQSINYLLKKYSVSYSYSSKLYVENFAKSYPVEKNIVGFGPSFNTEIKSAARSCTQDELSFLKCNQEELIGIEKILSGDLFLGVNATKSSFEEISKNVNSIHLATHACIDEDNQEFNRIYFQDDFLSNFDLTNMQIKANLAVLSACNTGSGKLVKGEGVMSLCKGFTLAGVPSVVMSLWSIDDCSSSSIMIDFYKNLSKGKTKDEALRNAKLNYLKNADIANAHPYYWAAFLQFGNHAPLQIKGTTNYYFYLGIGLMVFLLGFFLRYRRT